MYNIYSICPSPVSPPEQKAQRVPIKIRAKGRVFKWKSLQVQENWAISTQLETRYTSAYTTFQRMVAHSLQLDLYLLKKNWGRSMQWETWELLLRIVASERFTTVRGSRFHLLHSFEKNSNNTNNNCRNYLLQTNPKKAKSDRMRAGRFCRNTGRSQLCTLSLSTETVEFVAEVLTRPRIDRLSSPPSTIVIVD